MQRINVLTIVNVIDARLRKALTGSAKWNDAALSEIVARVKQGDNRGRVNSFGATFEDKLAAAAKQGDAFAVALRDVQNAWNYGGPRQERGVAFPLFAIIDARNAVAHKGSVAAEFVETFNASYPEFNLDAAGFVDVPEYLQFIVDAIDAAIVDDVALLKTFVETEAAVRLNHGIQGSASTAQSIVAAVANDDATVGGACGRAPLKGRGIAAYWKFNNLRNRYAHTGKITASNLVWLRKFAGKYGVQF